MNNEFLILNIREFLRRGKDGEKELERIFSSFSCEMNSDVEKFLLQQSMDFTKKNQSVTYIVIFPEHNKIVGYFTITIKPIIIKADCFSNTMKKKIVYVIIY